MIAFRKDLMTSIMMIQHLRSTVAEVIALLQALVRDAIALLYGNCQLALVIA